MRHVLVALALMMSVPGTAAAQASTVRTDTSPTQVTFTIENTSPFEMTCKGKLVAETRKGKLVEVRLSVVIPPGIEIEKFITRDDEKDPFVKGWPAINCDAQPKD